MARKEEGKNELTEEQKYPLFDSGNQQGHPSALNNRSRSKEVFLSTSTNTSEPMAKSITVNTRRNSIEAQ